MASQGMVSGFAKKRLRKEEASKRRGFEKKRLRKEEASKRRGFAKKRLRKEEALLGVNGWFLPVARYTAAVVKQYFGTNSVCFPYPVRG